MRIVIPLLQGSPYLDIPEPFIKPKKYLAPTPFNRKAGLTSGGFPDFSVWIRSFPVLIVEAKPPDVPVEVGYHEAQMYAAYLNQNYPTGINPAHFVFATNGVDFMAGCWDSKPAISGKVIDLLPQSTVTVEFQKLCGRLILEDHAHKCLLAAKAKRFLLPYNLAGGQALLRATVNLNQFAAPLAPLLQRYFSSSKQSSIKEIVERAYVSSDEVTEYDRILESLLKERVSARRGNTVEYLHPERGGEENFQRSISIFANDENLSRLDRREGHLQLIQGAVGSGKSLFMERYKQTLQPKAAKEKTKWATVDFLGAPVSLVGAEDWLCRTFIDSFQIDNRDIDFSDISVLRGIYSRKLQQKKPIYAELEKASAEKAAIRRAEDMLEWQDNAEDTTRGIAEYIMGSRQEALVVVMDNVDRLDRDNQLAAFQLTLWFLNLTRAFVVLQMRDETYERYKDRPPLDTYRTGVVFHISPPRFIDVVKRRLELSIEYLSKEAGRDKTYEIESGMRIRYSVEELQNFLTRLYNALFDRNRNISRVLEALAGKDVRRALEIFGAIITSGYLSTTTIASNTLGSGDVWLKEHTILRILMRTNRRFFSKDSGFVQNIFAYDDACEKPDNFLLIEILFYLFKNKKTVGLINVEGYFTCTQIADAMQKMGYVPDDVFLTLRHLTRTELVVTDRMNTTDLIWQDSIRILAAGWVHLRLLSGRFEYLFGCIPTTPIRDQKTAQQLADLLKIEAERGELLFYQKLRAVEIFFEYLWHERQAAITPFNDGPESGAEYVLGHIQESIEATKNPLKARTKNRVEDILDFER
ncbi:P-loop NTPase fold protein [Granulicella sp. L60]|uniref:P-loop NTPase fold protein n=1 Tax=Granulicella sp. L60 TaxID=1641866 RepID=UPI00131E3CC1|nr:P-loop NTPase fold protein [Granulicella sp. L60]